MLQPLGKRKVNIGWVFRPRTKYNSRAVVNEREMLPSSQIPELLFKKLTWVLRAAALGEAQGQRWLGLSAEDEVQLQGGGE